MSDIDTIREAHEQVRKLIYMVNRPKDYQYADVAKQSKHVDDCLTISLASIDRPQAQQPKTLSDEEIERASQSWAYAEVGAPQSSDRSGWDEETKDWWYTEYGRAIQVLRYARDNGYLSQPNAEPVAYAYSKDYEALYDLLMRGGEAIGKDYGGRPFRAERHIDNILLGVQYSSTEVFSIVHGREAFLSSCQRLQLEWIAPSTEPRLTVEQAMEVLEPFIEAEAEMEDGARWNWESKHKKYREMIEEIRDRLTKAAKQST